jgi:hypothetical protein
VIIYNWELKLKLQWQLESRLAGQALAAAAAGTVPAAAPPVLIAAGPRSVLMLQLGQGLAFTLCYSWFVYKLSPLLTPLACVAG